MLGRRTQKQKTSHYLKQKTKNQSISTLNSQSSKSTPKNPHLNKQKSQLCRKFMEYGYCPYKNKCKFAHGSHELKKNNSTNQKYKTKECGTYFKDGNCRFGERCNFLHIHSDQEQEANMKKIALKNYREIFYDRRNICRIYFMDRR